MSRRNRHNDGMSVARLQRLAFKKRRKKVSVLHTTCATCQALGKMEILAAKTRPLLLARLHEHYRTAHPTIVASGGVPVLEFPEQ